MSDSKSTFHPMFRTFAQYASDEDLREVKLGEIFSIANMDESEIRQAIIQDLLSPTLWEMEKGEAVHFDTIEFLRFVRNTGYRQQVLHLMWHDEIKDLIERGDNDQLRIKKDRASMQAAMDYCGVWAHGYDMPEGVIVTDFDAVDEAVEAHGGIENLAASLYFDHACTIQGNETRH